MTCQACGAQAVIERLDVGRHPVSSFFLVHRDDPLPEFRLALGQCENCGTVQSTAIVPHDALVPPYDWLFAREPEEHLDEVVDGIVKLPGMTTDSVIAGLTSKDDSTVERFVRMGFHCHWRVKLDEDLGITDPAANIETVQKLTEPGRMAAIAARRGAADLLIVRHILEHAENLGDFIRGLAALVKPGGLLMLEVPDCRASLDLADYCMIWEEHSLYLTAETFTPLSTIGGFEPISTVVYPRPFENSMVQIARKVGESGPVRIDAGARAQVGLLQRYAERYALARRALREKLEQVRAQKGPIALFGAGHLACAFANFMGVGDLIEFVADDIPQKQGKFLPGTRIPILPSAALAERKVALCLLALSINNENAVIARNETVLRGGGDFRSIFRSSPQSIFEGVA